MHGRVLPAALAERGRRPELPPRRAMAVHLQKLVRWHLVALAVADDQLVLPAVEALDGAHLEVGGRR